MVTIGDANIKTIKNMKITEWQPSPSCPRSASTAISPRVGTAQTHEKWTWFSWVCFKNSEAHGAFECVVGLSFRAIGSIELVDTARSLPFPAVQPRDLFFHRFFTQPVHTHSLIPLFRLSHMQKVGFLSLLPPLCLILTSIFVQGLESIVETEK